MRISPQRGEVWLVEMDPTRGAEIRKTRPAVVINRNSAGRLPLRLVVPLTAWNPANAALPWLVKVEAESTNGLSKMSAADVFQMRSVSLERMIRRVGSLQDFILWDITRAIAVTVGYRVEDPSESRIEE